MLTCLKQAGLSPKDVSLPIYYDLEEGSLRDKDQAAFAKAFFAPLEKKGTKQAHTPAKAGGTTI